MAWWRTDVLLSMIAVGISERGAHMYVGSIERSRIHVAVGCNVGVASSLDYQEIRRLPSGSCVSATILHRKYITNYRYCPLE
jgi:hypothetical protein